MSAKRRFWSLQGTYSDAKVTLLELSVMKLLNPFDRMVCYWTDGLTHGQSNRLTRCEHAHDGKKLVSVQVTDTLYYFSIHSKQCKPCTHQPVFEVHVQGQ